ncbi:reverse transcriptase-like protein [Carnobacteriaceae bacterium zg-C25]|nr:reverse transcriptase-like protein [Carnobacteriaceae bacterium zg-C25]
MIRVYVDAAFSNGNAGVGVVIYDGEKQNVQSFYIQNVKDNHHAEFQAMLLALDYIIDNALHRNTIQLFSDSLVVVKAIERLSAKNEWQHAYVEQLKERLSQFSLYFVNWFSQKDNQFVDKVAKRALLSGQDVV